MKDVTPEIKETIIKVLYSYKKESEQPISIMESETLYHLSFNKIIGGKNMSTGCSYSKDSIIKILCQELKLAELSFSEGKK